MKRRPPSPPHQDEGISSSTQVITSQLQNTTLNPISPASEKIKGAERIGVSEFKKRQALIAYFFDSGTTSTDKNPTAPKGAEKDRLLGEVLDEVKDYSAKDLQTAIQTASTLTQGNNDFTHKRTVLINTLQTQLLAPVMIEIDVRGPSTPIVTDPYAVPLPSRLPPAPPVDVDKGKQEAPDIVLVAPVAPAPSAPKTVNIKSSRRFFTTLPVNQGASSSASPAMPTVADDVDMPMDITTPDGQLFAIQALVEGSIDPYEEYLIKNGYVDPRNQVTRQGVQHIARGTHRGFNALYKLHNEIQVQQTPEAAWETLTKFFYRVWDENYQRSPADFEPLLINIFINAFTDYKEGSLEYQEAQTLEGFSQLVGDQLAKLAAPGPKGP